jgi:catechol 2,3-dioxygenase-like lactoylglutathione lyase family enzyme
MSVIQALKTQERACMGRTLNPLLPVLTLLVCGSSIAFEIDPDATIADSPTTLMGVNHIGLSVKDLDQMLAFYQTASDFKLVRRESVSNSPAADRLFGRPGVEYEIAVLEAPNMLFELIEFSHNADRAVTRMPVFGPGMTHTCFQSAASDSGYDKFRLTGADMLSHGDSPIDLAGQGVTYAYGYDPEGNMFEMEQLDQSLMAAQQIKQRWVSEGHGMWLTQVAQLVRENTGIQAVPGR